MNYPYIIDITYFKRKYTCFIEVRPVLHIDTNELWT